ncbi:MAG: hypothetical protein J0M07_13115 [Anaerolineae bacterium]|nr:hypothetical protein [Anaerolineae bacterium]
MTLLLTPIAAFLIYLALAALLSRLGHRLAGGDHSTPNTPHTSIYAGGERPPTTDVLPGYSKTFIVAFFFAIVHIGVLMLGSSAGSSAAAIYLVFLALSLLALILG